MATDKQKEAARRNIAKARQAQSARAHGEDVPRRDEGMSTADKDRLADREFAFPEERKEPLTDARHVRNAIARFDQVEGVSDAERDKAWKRILAAAKRYDVEVSESDWRELAKGGKATASAKPPHVPPGGGSPGLDPGGAQARLCAAADGSVRRCGTSARARLAAPSTSA